MTDELDTLLRALRNQPLDRSLDGLDGCVSTRMNEMSMMNTQTWRLRALATACVALSGIFISATTASTPSQASASSPWSSLAPSSLLEEVR